jgi:periplasmic copper chaperone A
MSKRTSRFLIGAAAATLAASLSAAEVKLENGWLRPAYAGQPAAMVYVDIESTEALKLVDAKSPVAKGAQLVLVDPPSEQPDKHKVVRELPVAANRSTRLAYLGSHVRLLDIQHDLVPGTKVPLELTFVDAKGTRRSVSTEALVRGIAARRPDAAEAEAAPNKR